MDIRSIQLNFSEYGCSKAKLENLPPLTDEKQRQYILTGFDKISYHLFYSKDGLSWTLLHCDEQSNPHPYFECQCMARYLRLEIRKMSFDGVASLSGFRVFGFGFGAIPDAIETLTIDWLSDTQAKIVWNKAKGAIGYELKWGIAKDKLYNSYLVYEKNELEFGSFTSGLPYWFELCSFNENGRSVSAVVQGRE
jgi:hypothetical protein